MEFRKYKIESLFDQQFEITPTALSVLTVRMALAILFIINNISCTNKHKIHGFQNLKSFGH